MGASAHHAIQPGVPAENILRMFDTGLTHGVYPCKSKPDLSDLPST